MPERVSFILAPPKLVRDAAQKGQENCRKYNGRVAGPQRRGYKNGGLSVSRRSTSAWQPILAGCCATLLGIGLQRFSYGPILPAMVQQGWLPAGQAGMLGGANLAGYLVGALGAGMVARALGGVLVLGLCMLAAVAGFALCAIQGGFLWFLPWRVLAGFTGGVLMVLAGPAVQAVVPVPMRGLASGMVIAGVGIGIVISAMLVPALLPWGLSAGWHWPVRRRW